MKNSFNSIILIRNKFYSISLFLLLILLVKLTIFDVGNIFLGPLFFILYLVLALKQKFDLKKISVFLFYFIISLAASIIFSHNDFLKLFSEILSIILFLAIIPSIRISEAEINKLFRMICFITFIMIVLRTLINLGIYNNNSYIFVNKNSWAQSLLFPMFISFYLFRRYQEKIYCLMSILLIFLIMVSASRTAIIAAGAFYTMYFLLVNKRKKYKILLSVVIMLLAISIIFTNVDITNYLSDYYIRSEYNLLTNRNELWKVAINTFSNSPVFGVGRGKAEEIILSSYIGMKNSEYHSFYYEILVYGGLVSFLFYIYIFLNALKNGFRLLGNKKKIGEIVISAAVAMLIYMLAETFYPFGFSYNNVISGLLIFSIPLAYLRGNITIEDNRMGVIE